MVIRKAKQTDAQQIVNIFHDTIHTVNTRDYSTEEVNAWSPDVPDADEWAKKGFQPESPLLPMMRAQLLGSENWKLTGT